MDYDEIRAAESHDPISYVANETDASISEPDELLTAGGTLIEQDVIAKVNAGAQLTFAVWSLPRDVVAALFRDAPAAFTKAYGAAYEAYGIGAWAPEVGTVALPDEDAEAIDRILRKHGLALSADLKHVKERERQFEDMLVKGYNAAKAHRRIP